MSCLDSNVHGSRTAPAYTLTHAAQKAHSHTRRDRDALRSIQASTHPSTQVHHGITPTPSQLGPWGRCAVVPITPAQAAVCPVSQPLRARSSGSMARWRQRRCLQAAQPPGPIHKHTAA